MAIRWSICCCFFFFQKRSKQNDWRHFGPDKTAMKLEASPHLVWCYGLFLQRKTTFPNNPLAPWLGLIVPKPFDCLTYWAVGRGSPFELQSYTLYRAASFLWGFCGSPGWFPWRATSQPSLRTWLRNTASAHSGFHPSVVSPVSVSRP